MWSGLRRGDVVRRFLCVDLISDIFENARSIYQPKMEVIMATATNNEVIGQIVYDTEYSAESVKGIVKDAITTTLDQGERISVAGIKAVSFSLMPMLSSLFSTVLAYLGLNNAIAAPVAGISTEQVKTGADSIVDTCVPATCSVMKQVLHVSAEKSIDCSARSWRWWF